MILFLSRLQSHAANFVRSTCLSDVVGLRYQPYLGLVVSLVEAPFQRPGAAG
jgi:hypothetical protein